MSDLTNNFLNFLLLKRSGVKHQESFVITKSHGDKITKIPDNFVAYGNSKYVEVEAFVSKCGRYFGMQGHPEYNPGYLASRTAAIKAKLKNRDGEQDYLDELMMKLKKKYEGEVHETQARALCYHFLRTPLEVGDRGSSQS